MKLLLVLSFAAFALNASARRDCYYDTRGLCRGFCPEGTQSYTSGCGPITPEATCDDPNPVPENFDTCDFSTCYCIPPTVRDTTTNKCVPLDECPNKTAFTQFQQRPIRFKDPLSIFRGSLGDRFRSTTSPQESHTDKWIFEI